MFAFMRGLVIAAGLTLIALAVIGLTTFFQWPRMAKSGLERSLTYMLEAPASIESVDIAPAQGILEVHGLTLYNPAAFEDSPAMEFDRVIVEIDRATLFSTTPSIERMTFQDGTVYARYELGRGFNLSHLAEAGGQHRLDNGEPNAWAGWVRWPSLSVPRMARKRFIIKEVRGENIELQVSTNLAPVTIPDMEAPDFVIYDVGGDRPVSLAQVTPVFVRTLILEVLGVRSIFEPIAEMLQREMDAMGGLEPETGERETH